MYIFMPLNSYQMSYVITKRNSSVELFFNPSDNFITIYNIKSITEVVTLINASQTSHSVIRFLEKNSLQAERLVREFM